MSVGSELKHAREREGLSAEQIAERTKVPLYKIEALEDDRFENLPDGIYLDGIIRAYAREIAVDPEPLIQRGREERGVVPENWAIDFDGLNGVLKKNAPVHDPIVDEAVDARLTPSAFITPAQIRASHDGSGSSRTVKMAFVLVAALAVAGWGAYLNERTRRGDRVASMSASPAPSTPEPLTPPTETPPPNVPPTRAEPATATPRADTSQPASNREAATAGVSRPASPPATRVSPPRSTPPSATPPASVPPAAAASATPPATAATPQAAPQTTSSTPQAMPNAAPATAATHNVSGAWTFTTNVESTSLQAFSGLRLGYEIQLTQKGDHVSGSGRKITENGTAIGSQAQTPITLEGTIKGDRLTLTFTEKGRQRDSQGRFVLLADEGTLRGRFSSTAAQSSGTVEAHRAAGTR